MFKLGLYLHCVYACSQTPHPPVDQCLGSPAVVELENRVRLLSAYVSASPPTPQQFKDCEATRGVSSTGGFCVNTAENIGGNELWCEATAAKLAVFFAGRYFTHKSLAAMKEEEERKWRVCVCGGGGGGGGWWGGGGGTAQ
jgi:hypothetical protein